MRRLVGLCFAMLLGGVLSVALMGVVVARPESQPLNSTVTGTLTVSAADCYPASDGIDFVNGGSYLRPMTGEGTFLCPVDFPERGDHEIKTITLYAYDNHPDEDVCATAYRTDPSTASQAQIGQVCSTGSDTTDPRPFTIQGGDIGFGLIDPEHGMYVLIAMQATPDLFAYGLRIGYECTGWSCSYLPLVLEED
jgi:hypothetical protein